MDAMDARTGIGRILPTLLLAAAAGSALWWATGLTPVAWVAWVAPVPALWLLLSIERRWLANVAAFIVAVVACSHYVPYFALVMPPVAAGLATLGQSLVWTAVLSLSRRVMQQWRRAWTVLACPLLWVAADTLMAALLPDGNWGSLAYSQADLAWVRQLAALGGTGAILFVLCLVPSTLALLLWRQRIEGQGRALVGTAMVLVAALGYGALRVSPPPSGTPVRVGMASIDDAIGMQASPAYSATIRDRYGALVAQLAGQGATLVVLPEKIAVIPPEQAEAWRGHFAALAARHRLWLEVGMAIDDGAHPRNQAWLFDPDGRLAGDFQKHFLAPPERAQAYASGNRYDVHDIAETRVGLAVCKDMHFASFGRAYGMRQAGVLLVPAWDFAYTDAWMAARMTALRGVENGYTVIRASREGLMSVSDATGRFLAQTRSAPMPGATLLAEVPLGLAWPTLYTRFGNAFGWACVALSLLMLAWPARGRRRG
jgi:apolipoprotein N-acyltransferase